MPKEVCQQVAKVKYETVTRKECQEVADTACDNVEFDQECSTRYENKCAPVMEKMCTTNTEAECKVINKRKCEVVQDEVCEDGTINVPKQECRVGSVILILRGVIFTYFQERGPRAVHQELPQGVRH